MNGFAGGMSVEYGKFVLFGEDKKSFIQIKNTLVSNGHVFTGYWKDTLNILRSVRSSTPELIFIDAGNRFRELRQTLEVIDEDILTACILVLDTRNNEVLDFLGSSRAMAYITKPVYDEALLQIVDLTLMSYKRVLEYEQQVKKLNDTLEIRKIVEKAKWILVEREGYKESEAYEAIRRKSRDNRMTMRQIAEAIILTRS